MSQTEDTPSLEAIIEGEASEEEVEAYNEQKEAEFRERIEQRRRELDALEQDAADALLDDAESTVDTETVELESGLELEVRTRFPQSVEQLRKRLEQLEQQGAPTHKLAELNCEMLAAMTETDGYDSPDPWLVAYSDNDAGMQWLTEAIATVTEPAAERAEETKGKLTR